MRPPSLSLARLVVPMARAHLSALVAVALAVGGGAAILTGVGALAESGLRSHVTVDRLSGADVVVSADQEVHPPEDLAIPLPERVRVPADLVDRLRSTPGVTAAVGDVSLAAALVVDGRVVTHADPHRTGHGWSSLTVLTGGTQASVHGVPPRGPDQIAVDSTLAAEAGLAPGGTVGAVVAGTPGTYRVTAVVDSPSAGILFDDPTAARLAAADGAPGQVDLVALRTEPGQAEAVAQRLRASVGGGLVVSTGASRGDVEAPGDSAGRSTLVLVAGSVGGVALLVVAFIIVGAVGVAMQAQRREIALLRAVGATPGQVRSLVAGQATVVSLLALVPGVAGGYLVVGRLHELMTSVGLVTANLPVTVGPIPGAVTVVLLVLIVQLAARWGSARTSRMPAIEAVVESVVEPRTPSSRRRTAGLLTLVSAVGVGVAPLFSRTEVAAAGTGMAGILAAVGVALLGPHLVRAVTVRLRSRRRSGGSAPAWLAVANSHAQAARVGAAVSTLALTVVFTLTYALTQTTVLDATRAEAAAGTRADVTVSAPRLGRVPAGVLRDAAATPGVRAATPVSDTTVLWPVGLAGGTEVEPRPALVLTPSAAAAVDLDVRSGSLSDLKGATIAVAAGASRAKLGSTVAFRLGDGSAVRARVVAVYGRGLGFGPVVVSRDLVAGHARLDQRLLVVGDGTSTTTASLQALAAAHPGVEVEQRSAGGAAAVERGVPRELWLNVVVLGVLLGYLMVGVANKLVAATIARGREIASLRLVGATPGQVRAMVRWEAALASAVAVLTGTALSVLPLAMLGAGFLGRPWASGPIWIAPAVAVCVVAVTFVSMEIPVRRALRTPPTAALARAT